MKRPTFLANCLEPIQLAGAFERRRMFRKAVATAAGWTPSGAVEWLSILLIIFGPLSAVAQGEINRPAGTLVRYPARFLPYVDPGTRFTAIVAAHGFSYNVAL